MTVIIQELLHAGKLLSRSGPVPVVAAATLGLGISFATCLFSIFDAVVLKPLPFKEPEQLVEISWRTDDRAGMRVPAAALTALRASSTTLVAIATHAPVAAAFRSDVGLIDIRGDRVSGNFTDVIGVDPLRGRRFTLADETERSAVVIVSYQFWRTFLSASNDVIGRTISLNGAAFTVIGVMPSTFRTTFTGLTKDYWTTHATEREREQDVRAGAEVIARLRDGVSVAQATQEARSIGSAAAKEKGGIDLELLRREIVGQRADAIKFLLGAEFVLLLAACGNLALLFLARADFRVTEFATRKALGASSRTLFRSALIESLLVSIAGCILGVALASLGLPLVLQLAPTDIPRLSEATIDARTVAASFSLATLTGILFGALPALEIAKRSTSDLLRMPSLAGPRVWSWRSFLVGFQVAASTTLIVISGLLAQTFLRLFPANPGFDTASRSTFLLVLPSRVFPTAADRVKYLEGLVRNTAVQPHVIGAAIATNVPFSGDALRSSIRSGEMPPQSSPFAYSDVRAISENYFALMNMKMVAGRPFTGSPQNQNMGTAIVNLSMARQLGGPQRALGKTIRVGGPATLSIYEVTGVVADTRSDGDLPYAINEVYIPYQQSNPSIGYVVIHSSAPPNELTSMMVSQINTTMPMVPLRPDFRAVPLQETLSRAVARPTFNAAISATFAGFVFVLCALGVSGLVMYTTARRKRELAIRSALGATPYRLITENTREVLCVAGGGIVFGLMAAVYAARLIRAQLSGTQSVNPESFIAATLVMLACILASALLPAAKSAYAPIVETVRSP